VDAGRELAILVEAQPGIVAAQRVFAHDGDVAVHVQGGLRIVSVHADPAIPKRETVVPVAIILVVEARNTAGVGRAPSVVYVQSKGLPSAGVDDSDSGAIGLRDEGDVPGQRQPVRILRTEATRGDNVQPVQWRRRPDADVA
jgi:hypothetical protein